MAQVIPIKLFSPLSSRQGTVLKDSRLVNGFAEKSAEGEEVWVYRRPGLVPYQSLGAAVGRGVFNWKNDVYAVFGGTLFKNGVAVVGSVAATGMYTFTACLGATPRLFLKNNTNAYVYDAGGGLVAVVDADYPAATVPGCVYLDGTTYVFDTSNNIHGSDFNNQASWDPLNLIVAQMSPDPSVALASQLAYVVALKQVTTEVFHDAGNALGSPLAPVQGSKLDVGCRAAGSVCDVSGALAWVGTTKGGSVKVMYMEKVRGQDISSPSVERLLTGLDFSTTWSWSMECSGHKYYVVTVPAANLTLAFDVDQGTWYLWTDTGGNYLPIVSATYDAQGQVLAQHASNGKLYHITTAVNTDDGVPIPFKLYTPNWDGGQRVAKTFASFEVVGDQSPVNLLVSWSDDDYQTYTTPKAVSMNQDRPLVPDGSSFRKRSWLFANSEDAYLRIKRFEPMASAGLL